MSAASAAALWICAAGAALVFGVMLASILRFPHAQRAGVVSRNWREFVWALVPIVIVIAAAAPSLQERSIASNSRLAQRPATDAPFAVPAAAHPELEVHAAASRR